MRKVLPAAFCTIGLAFIIWALVDTLYNQGVMYLTALGGGAAWYFLFYLKKKNTAE